MAARFSFAVAEAQKKVDEGAFFDKQGIGDYMAILASGLKEGLQEKERQDLIKEKEKKAAAAKLREKQQAAEKLTKDIDNSAKLLLKVNGLAQNTALLPEIINIMTAQGSTNTSAAQAYIDNIENIADFQSGYDMNMTLTEGQSPVTPKVKMVNKNTSDVGGMNLAEVAHALNTPNLNVERKNALNERLAFLQTQGSEKTDSYWVDQITPDNIDILLPEFRKRQDEMVGDQWKRVSKKINALRKLPEYQDKSDELPYKNKDGSYKGDTELRQMLNDKNLKLSANERADILAILAPIDFEKPVKALGVNGVILERSKLLDQQQSEQLDEAQTSRLNELEAAYQSFIAAGKIKEKEVYDPVKEAVDINESGKTSETLLLFEDKLKDGELDGPDQQLYNALKLLDSNPSGKFSKLDKMIFRDYSNNSNDRVKLRDTIELLDEQLKSYTEDKSSFLSDEKFMEYKRGLLTLKAIEDAYSNDDKAKANELSFDLTNDYAEITLKGDKNPTQVRLTKKGNFFIESGSRAGKVIARNSKDYVEGSLTPSTSQVEALSKLINRNDDFSTKLSDLKTNSAKLVDSTVRLLGFVNENEAVLTIGAFAAQADKIITGISQTLQLMKTSNTVNEAKIIEDSLRLGMAEFEEANKDKADYQKLAATYEQFLSLSLGHAFQYAALKLDSKGQALSNFDFSNSLTINNAGIDFETYATNILNNVSDVVDKASVKFDDYLKNDMEHVGALKNKLYKETFEQTDLKAGGVKTFLEKNYPQEYAVVNAWMTDKTLPARTNAASVSTSTGNTPTQPVVTLQQAQSILTNSATEEYAKFMNDATKVGNREKAYNALAKEVYKTSTPTAEQLSHIKQYMEGLIVSNPSNNTPF